MAMAIIQRVHISEALQLQDISIASSEAKVSRTFLEENHPDNFLFCVEKFHSIVLFVLIFSLFVFIDCLYLDLLKFFYLRIL